MELFYPVPNCLLYILADFNYFVNRDFNIGVSVTRVGNTLLNVMCICEGVTVTHIYPRVSMFAQNVTENVTDDH